MEKRFRGNVLQREVITQDKSIMLPTRFSRKGISDIIYPLTWVQNGISAADAGLDRLGLVWTVKLAAARSHGAANSANHDVSNDLA